MPTGYTAKLMSEGQSFRDFVLLCARAMGACVMMRDDSLSADIPEKFAPSDYSAKPLEESIEKVKSLQAMTTEQREAFGAAEKVKTTASLQSSLDREIKEHNRLETMRLEVEAWKPPTPDHEGLKRFMLEQIKISDPSMDYYQRGIAEAEARSPMGFFVAALSQARHDIEYHKKADREERERTEGRNLWIAQLRESI